MFLLNSPQNTELSAEALERTNTVLNILKSKPAFQEFTRRYNEGYFTRFIPKYAAHHSKEELWAIAMKENWSKSPNALLLAANKLLQENDNYKSPTAERLVNLYCNQILDELREEYSNTMRYDVTVHLSDFCVLS